MVLSRGEYSQLLFSLNIRRIERYLSGLYDPILDDTELVYVPILEEEYESYNNQGQTYANDEETHENQKYGTKLTDAQQTEKRVNTIIEDEIRSKLKNALLHINVDDLPPTARFKLPISEEYDPEGKKVSKLRKLYDKHILKIDVNKLTDQIKPKENEIVRNIQEISQNKINKETGEKKTFKEHEMTKEEFKYTENKHDIDLNTIHKTASDIVEKSINKAMSIAVEKKQKCSLNLEKKEHKKVIHKAETKLREELKNVEIKPFKVTKIEQSLSPNKSIKEEREIKRCSLYDKKETKKIFTDKTVQEKAVNLTNEYKKIELFQNELESKLTTEERKLLTQQDIQEAIEPGTVRDRTETFKKYNIDVGKKSDQKYEKSDRKDMKHATRISNIKLAQQRIYKLGSQTIVNIRRIAQSSYHSHKLLKTFLSKITKFMIYLSKSFTTKPSEYFYHPNNRQVIKSDRDDVWREGELIVKCKLSGAKIARIEGLKPIELTDKMDIVISELQRRSGIEESSDRKDFFQRRRSKSQSKIDEDNIYRNKTDDKNNLHDDFYHDNSYEKKNFDSKKYHTYETTKTQTSEIRETKTEKRYSEHKTTKVDSTHHRNEEETDIRQDVKNDGNVIYIAIVEAHVYTNKDAIFEERLRQMSESKVIDKSELIKDIDESESLEKTKLYVSVDESRKLSLASPVLIEPIEVYSTEKIQPVKYIRSATDLEEVVRKIAVQNITQVIEPLLNFEVNKFATSKHAHEVIEIPMKKIAETTDVTTEEEKMYFQAQVFVTQKSYISVEKTDKAVVEITEISVDEDQSGVFEESKVKIELPQPTIEEPDRSIAETAEILIEEDQIEEIEFPKPLVVLPRTTVEMAVKSAAVISEILLDDSLNIFDVPVAINKQSTTALEKTILSAAQTEMTTPEFNTEYLSDSKTRQESAKFEIGGNIAAEVFQVSSQEPMNEEIKIVETKRRQSQVFVEKSFMFLPETITTTTEEPKNVELVIQKHLMEKANIDIETSVAAEIIEVSAVESEYDTFNIPKISDVQSDALLEKTSFSVASTTKNILYEPQCEFFETPKISDHQANINLETGFILPEKLSVLSAETVNQIIETKIQKLQAKIDMEEMKAAEIITVIIAEPKNEDIQVPQIVEKIPQTTLESLVLTIAESLTTFPEGPKEGSLEIAEAPKDEPRVDVMELKPLTSVIVFTEDQHGELHVSKIDEKLPQFLMEYPVLTIGVSLIILPGGPNEGTFEIDERNEKQLQYSMAVPLHIIAESLIIIPDGPKDGSFNIDEPKTKQPKVIIQDTKLNIAESFSIIPEEPKDELLEINKTVIQKARIEIEELKATESNIISFEESVIPIVESQKLKGNIATIAIVASIAAMIAETTCLTLAKEEVFRTIEKDTKVKVTIEEPVMEKAKLEIVDVSEDSKNFEEIELNYTVELPKDDKIDEVFAEATITKQKSPPAETYAEFDFKENKVDVESNVFESIKLMNKRKFIQDTMEASFDYIINEEIKKMFKDVSGASSPDLPSSPLTPLIEEYIFRIKGPLIKRYLEVFEEVTLKLKSKIRKATVQNFDASLTLILQDFVKSTLQQSEEIGMESVKYIASKDISMEYVDSNKLSRSQATLTSESQSLHTGLAIATAASKQAIETGIDVSVLSLEQKSITNSRLFAERSELSMEASSRKTSSASSRASSMRAELTKFESANIQNASYSQSIESHAASYEQSLEASMEYAQSSTAVSRSQVSEMEMSKSRRKGASKSSALTIEDISDRAIQSHLSSVSDKKLSIKTDIKVDDILTDGSRSPPTKSPTPVIDEYMFVLEIELPKTSQYVYRDCSYSPDIITDDIVLKNGLIPHIRTKIYRILYSPPLPTPPISPDKTIPIYKKPGTSSDAQNTNIFKFLS